MNFRIFFGILLIATAFLATSGATSGSSGWGESICKAISYFFRKLISGVPKAEQPSTFPKKTYTYDDLPAINARHLYPSLTQYPNSGFDYQSKIEPSSKTDNTLVERIESNIKREKRRTNMLIAN
ncbi:uncharacterized protein LOC119614836 [Lucilia sericata]|uniref:uncharacterized protein LOC119614836 n=1 Tax=Lucilia sericata TaxID=13632 RepID=UPI0018A8819D|nr:uncharacterized protein LOC119614836 [Lucilia sericata]